MAIYDFNAALKPVESPIDQYGRLMQLKNLGTQQQLQQQEMQLRGQQIQQGQMDLESQKAVMRAYTEANGDLDKAVPLAAQYGAKPDALMKLRQTSMQMQEQNLQLLNAKGARALQEADLMKGAHDQVSAVAPEQRPQAYQQALFGLQKAGVDVSSMPAQYPGDEAFKFIGAGVTGHKAQLEDLAKQAGIGKDIAQTGEANAKAEEATQSANKAKMEAQFMQQFGMPLTGPAADAKYRFIKMQQAQGKPTSPDDAAFLKGYSDWVNLTKVQPGVARMEILMQRPVQVGDPNNPGETIMVPQNKSYGMAGPSSSSVVTPKAEAKYMTSGAGGKQLTAFNTAIQHLDTLDRLAGDLQNGNIQIANKARQAWAEQTGNPAPANFASAKNAMSGEVAAALKASGATDQEITQVGSTFNRAQSPAQLKGAINTYRELLKSKAGQLKKQYESGMQGKPAFDNQQAQPQATHRFNPATGKIEAIQQ